MKNRLRNILTLTILLTLSILAQSCKVPVSSVFTVPDTIDCGSLCPSELPKLSLVGSNPLAHFVNTAITPVTFNSSDMTECVLVLGILPAGLSLNSSNCTITGTPTLVGTTTLILRAQNNFGVSPNASVTLTYISAPPVITLISSTLNAQVNSPVSASVVTSNQTLTSCSFIGTAVPGLNYNTGSCTITGTPTAVANANITINGSNLNGTSNSVILNIIVIPEAPVISTSTPSVVAKKGSSLSAITFSTTETISNCTMTAVPGLLIDTATCEITGTPTSQTVSAGTTIAVQATGVGGNSNTVNINLKVYQSYCDGLGVPGSATPVRGNGTSGDPYVLCGRQGLSGYLFSNSDQSFYYKMGDDVDMGGVIFQTDRAKPFAGHFDGGGHVISGIVTDDIPGDGVGFFSMLANNASVKRIVFDGNRYNGNSKIGTIVGSINAGATVTIQDIVIINSNVSTVVASNFTGSGIGYVNSGAIVNVSNILIYGMTTDSAGSPKVFTGTSAAFTKNYSNVIYDVDMELNGFSAETMATSHPIADLRNLSTYSTFDTSWDLTPTASNNPATLKKNADQVYTDGVVMVN